MNKQYKSFSNCFTYYGRLYNVGPGGESGYFFNTLEEVKNFTSNVLNLFKNTIVEGDKVYFNNSTFPALLFNQIIKYINDNTPTTSKTVRVTTESKATCIVTNTKEKNTVRAGFVNSTQDFAYATSSSVAKIQTLFQDVEDCFNLAKQITLSSDDVSFFIDFPESWVSDDKKVVSDYALQQYLWSICPKLDNEQATSIFNMIKTPNNRRMGLQLLVYYNWSDYAYKFFIDNISKELTSVKLESYFLHIVYNNFREKGWRSRYAYNICRTIENIQNDLSNLNVQLSDEAKKEIIKLNVIKKSRCGIIDLNDCDSFIDDAIKVIDPEDIKIKEELQKRYKKIVYVKPEDFYQFNTVEEIAYCKQLNLYLFR